MQPDVVKPAWKPGRVVVVGDVMLDRYWSGEVDRISPEAPVPVVLIKQSYDRSGGAANVALNAASLGAQVSLFGIVGVDEAADLVRLGLQQAGISCRLTADPQFKTTLKLRVLGRHQQMIRLDFESHPEPAALVRMERDFAEAVQGVDVVVFSDYSKGVLANVASLIQIAQRAGKQVIVDPKGRDFRRYAGADVITPNRSELALAAEPWRGEAELADVVARLRAQLSLKSLLLTRSEEGMTLFNDDGAFNYPTEAREVFDVSGAGDTVVAVLAACLSAGMSLLQAIPLANRAAGIVVGRVGTASVTSQDLALG